MEQTQNHTVVDETTTMTLRYKCVGYLVIEINGNSPIFFQTMETAEEYAFDMRKRHYALYEIEPVFIQEIVRQ